MSRPEKFPAQRRRRPQLAVVVDTEEEFDWGQPFSRDNVSTRSIPAQALAHEVYDRLGVVPTYAIDYPVAADPIAVRFLRGLKEEGRAEIGAHLHPWVSPPHDEAVTTFNSYHCNLPPALERAKIERLTAAIEEAFGERPTVFKAGRYGFGAHTAKVLAELGYQVDCSVVPHTGFAGDGGPSFYGQLDQPFWLDRHGGVLEVPLTSGFFGPLSAAGPSIAPLFDNPAAARLRLPAILARLGVGRSRLSPEGVPAREQCRLLESLVRSGHSFFTLTYHSPSLAPGNTMYVGSEEELQRFIGSIAQVLTFFKDGLGGEFTTLTRYRAEISAEPARD